MLFGKNKKTSETLLHFREKSKKKKERNAEKLNQKEAIQESQRMLSRAELRKERRIRRKKLKKEVQPHVHRNNIVKNQLISRVKASRPKNELIKSSNKIVSVKREKIVKLTEQKKIDKTATLIYKSVIMDPRDLSREFAKLGDNPELINKVIRERTKRTIAKLRSNRESVPTSRDRAVLYTDLSIIELAIQRGFRPKYLRVDKEMEKNVAYDSYISLTECLHEIAFYYSKQKKFKEVDKIDNVDLKDIDAYVLAKMRNPLQHIDEVCEKIEPEKSNEIVMELERKFNGTNT